MRQKIVLTALSVWLAALTSSNELFCMNAIADKITRYETILQAVKENKGNIILPTKFKNACDIIDSKTIHQDQVTDQLHKKHISTIFRKIYEIRKINNQMPDQNTFATLCAQYFADHPIIGRTELATSIVQAARMVTSSSIYQIKDFHRGMSPDGTELRTSITEQVINQYCDNLAESLLQAILSQPAPAKGYSCLIS